MSTPNLIKTWLDAHLSPAHGGTLQDKWRVYLIQQGYTFKNIPATLYKYFGDQGYTGTLSRRYQKWIDLVIYP